MLGHEDERGEVMVVVHAEAPPEGLGEEGLARPELTPQAEEVARRGDRTQRLP